MLSVLYVRCRRGWLRSMALYEHDLPCISRTCLVHLPMVLCEQNGWVMARVPLPECALQHPVFHQYDRHPGIKIDLNHIEIRRRYSTQKVQYVAGTDHVGTTDCNDNNTIMHE